MEQEQAKRHTGRADYRRVAALFLIFPIAFSVLEAGGWSTGSAASLIPGEDEVQEFRARLMNIIIGAGLSATAYIILLRHSAGRAIRTATGILLSCELYTLAYYGYMFLIPEGRSAESDAIGSTILLISTIACCYAWSLILSHPKLDKKEKAVMIFIPMQYTMSFVAFYAMTWQRYIPQLENNGTLLLDHTFLYVLFAILWNILRGTAMWKMCHSELYGNSHETTPGTEAAYSPFNRYMAAIAIASYLVIQGLALIYRNAHLLMEL
jgi:hypothetical protein